MKNQYEVYYIMPKQGRTVWAVVEAKSIRGATQTKANKEMEETISPFEDRLVTSWGVSKVQKPSSTVNIKKHETLSTKTN